MIIDFCAFSPWANGLILFGGGSVVWLAGTRLSAYADAVTRKTGLTRALAGALLLGSATSLPEITTTVTASALDNAPLAVNNLFGGVAMQLAVLAVVDLWFVRGALTYFSPKPVLLLGGVLLIVQTALAVASVAVGDFALGGYVGVWPIVMTGVYVGTLYFMNRFSNRDSWIPAEMPTEVERANRTVAKSDYREHGSTSVARIAVKFAVSCIWDGPYPVRRTLCRTKPD